MEGRYTKRFTMSPDQNVPAIQRRSLAQGRWQVRMRALIHNTLCGLINERRPGGTTEALWEGGEALSDSWIGTKILMADLARGGEVRIMSAQRGGTVTVRRIEPQTIDSVTATASQSGAWATRLQ